MILPGSAFVCSAWRHAIARTRITARNLTLGKRILDADGAVTRGRLCRWWHAMTHHRSTVGPHAATIRRLHHHWVAGRTRTTAVLISGCVWELASISFMSTGGYTHHHRTTAALVWSDRHILHDKQQMFSSINSTATFTMFNVHILSTEAYLLHCILCSVCFTEASVTSFIGAMYKLLTYLLTNLCLHTTIPYHQTFTCKLMF